MVAGAEERGQCAGAAGYGEGHLDRFAVGRRVGLGQLGRSDLCSITRRHTGGNGPAGTLGPITVSTKRAVDDRLNRIPRNGQIRINGEYPGSIS